jgi:quinol-cytochrome oxidoreductase complex cytochrome b subunit
MSHRIINWIDQRFPLSSFVKRELTDYPTPRNLNYWWNFGFMAGIMLMIQIVTGIFLAMHYKPDAALAFDSVQHIMRDVHYGWLLRDIHSTGASAFFILIYIHMARTLYYASYHKPRELMWWGGQVILITMMATAFMGYLLPWGQMSYWGAQVITDLFRATPYFGDQIVIWLRGGFSVSNDTLTRFFALHYLFPFLIVALVFIHLVALHHVRSSNPSGVQLAAKDNIPFHPYFTYKDLFTLGIFFTIFLGFVFYAPDFFLEPENNIPADPLHTPQHIVPEWYFLPFYAILRAIPDTLGGAVALTMSVLIFATMPYFDRTTIPGGARWRPVYRGLFFVFMADVLLLGYLGTQHPHGWVITASVIAASLYFAAFLTLPFVSKFEERWLCKRGLPPALNIVLSCSVSTTNKPVQKRDDVL